MVLQSAHYISNFTSNITQHYGCDVMYTYTTALTFNKTEGFGTIIIQVTCGICEQQLQVLNDL